MSKTTTINSTNSGRNSSNRKNQSTPFVATAVGGAGLGVAGAQIASAFGGSEDILDGDDLLIAEVSEVVEPGLSSESDEEETVAKIEPVQEDTDENSEDPSSLEEPVVELTSEDDDIVTPEIDLEEQTISSTNSNTNTANTVADPDEVADVIISGTNVDPYDIDMPDVINFDEIGTIHTVEGESYTIASFYDANGSNLIMIDVDNDNIFDVITDYEGNLIAEVPGNISVGDAQEDLAEDDEYLAYEEDLDNVDEYDEDSLDDDLMA